MRLINLIILSFLLIIGLHAEHVSDKPIESYVTCPAADTIYVDHTADSGSNNGSSWTNAYTNLQDAIDQSSGCPNTMIWVAKGTYAPTKANSVSSSNNARDTTFLIESPVKIFGGFSSGATTLSERDSISGNTILTGILNGGDTAYHVIFIRDGAITSDYEINGFKIINGNADGSSVDGNGGGLHMSTAGVIEARIANCIFEVNMGKDGGGLFANANSSDVSMSIVNCSFINNQVSNRGGGIYMNSSSTADPTLLNCIFSNNTSTNAGGGLYANGGNTNTTKIINCSFSNNSSTTDNGGGMSLLGSTNTPSISNSILWGNTATVGADVYQNNSGGSIKYSIMTSGGANNIPSYTATKFEDPLFEDPDTHDLRLKSDSPGINEGSNVEVPTDITTDFNGNNRIRYGTVDMGAYEGVPCLNVDVLYVNSSNLNPGNGTQWFSALTDLQEAINISNTCGGGKQIWVAEGTYRPTQIYDLDNNSVLEEREKAFYISQPVAIYGGFTSGQTTLSQRDSLGGGTILTGDLGNNQDTAYHVITMNADTVGTDWHLNGLTIRDGRANARISEHKNGGGIYLPEYQVKIFKASLSNCNITNNTALESGGGIYAVANYADELKATLVSSPTFFKCSISNNFAGSQGGGIYANAFNLTAVAEDHDATASPTFIDCLIFDNHVRGEGVGPPREGGGIYVSAAIAASPTFIGCSIYGNSSTSHGGGIYIRASAANTTASPEFINCSIHNNSSVMNGGGIYTKADISGTTNADASITPTFTNCAIYNNLAGVNGGGFFANTNLVFNSNSNASTSSTFTNCSIYNNTADNHGGGIYTLAEDYDGETVNELKINNSILCNNIASGTMSLGQDIWKNNSNIGLPNGTITHSILSSPTSVEGMITYTDTLIQDPMFVNTTSGSEDLRLMSGSPAINAGLNQAITSTTDWDGKTRLIGGAVDMGAYEHGEESNCNDQNVFLHPTQLENVTTVYTTIESIFATNKIISDDITFNAQLGIELGHKFEVAQGALFQAFLDGCR